MQRTLILLSSVTLLSTAEPLPSSLSMQGYTGLINTPNAQVMQEGDIVFSFNNQFDNHLRGYDYTKKRSFTEDYVFGAGLLPNLEIQGRLKEQSGYTRDLSANIKYQLPLFHEYLPNIALGAQDVGSAANNYENYYIVADKSYSFLRASLGYGYSNNNSDPTSTRNRSSRSPRMDGLFGGLEARVAPWASVLAEYDGEESHAGLRLNMPKEWSEQVRLNATIASNLSDDGRVSFMINAVIPLQRDERYLSSSSTEAVPYVAVEKDSQKNTIPTVTNAKSIDESLAIQKLIAALIADELQNIDIRTSADTLYIAYENTVYIHNELDAIGTVLRKAVKLSAYYKKFVIQPKKSNVLITSIRGSLEKAETFYTNPSHESKTAFIASLSEGKAPITEGEVRAHNENPGLFKTHVVVSPKVTTFVGTEVGAFDYQLLMGFTAYLNLYKGLDFSTRYDVHIANSDELDPIYGIFGLSYNDGGFNSAMLHYTMNLSGGLNTLSGGLYLYDYVGVMEQFIYNFERHTFKLKLGYFEHIDYNDLDKEIYLAKYTYNYAPLDLYLEAQVGKYWYQDTGFGLNVKRYFEDVAISVNYLQTSPDGEVRFSESTNQYIGLAIEIPLDFRKSKSNWKHLQIQGDSNWDYEQRSTIARADGTNIIVPFSGYDPKMDLESETYLMNRNRINVEYVQNHSERLLDSF